MQLSTTYRGLNHPEAITATRLLERNMHRLSRLVSAQTLLKAVVEGAHPEHRVILSTSSQGTEFTSESNGHDLSLAINTASERLLTQIKRHRERRESKRHRTVDT